MKTRILSLLLALSLSSCCTTTGAAINAVEKLETADAPLPVQIIMYPVQVVALAVLFPMVWVCWMTEEM